MKPLIFCLAGAIAGGVAGYFGFMWIAHQGFYALVLPGALVGLGASLAPNRSLLMCIVCGAMALALGFFSEWKFAPFIKNDSLAYFAGHIQQLKPVTLIMIAAGACIGFWGPYSRLKPKTLHQENEERR